MKSMRGFFSLVMVLGGFASVIFMMMAFSAEGAIHEIEALIAALIIVVVVAAGYLGAVIDDNFERIWPKAIQPSAQQQAQGPQ